MYDSFSLFSNSCLCLQIHHLAVNALLKSNQVNEMEGGALFGSEHDSTTGPHDSHEQSGFDEATSCAPAFRVLKQLIQRCLADAVTSGNVFADAILQHLYRWLCRLFCLQVANSSYIVIQIRILTFSLLSSPHSKLHDPALHRMLHKVILFHIRFIHFKLDKCFRIGDSAASFYITPFSV